MYTSEIQSKFFSFFHYSARNAIDQLNMEFNLCRPVESSLQETFIKQVSCSKLGGRTPNLQEDFQWSYLPMHGLQDLLLAKSLSRETRKPHVCSSLWHRPRRCSFRYLCVRYRRITPTLVSLFQSLYTQVNDIEYGYWADCLFITNLTLHNILSLPSQLT